MSRAAVFVMLWVATCTYALDCGPLDVDQCKSIPECVFRYATMRCAERACADYEFEPLCTMDVHKLGNCQWAPGVGQSGFCTTKNKPAPCFAHIEHCPVDGPDALCELSDSGVCVTKGQQVACGLTTACPEPRCKTQNGACVEASAKTPCSSNSLKHCEEDERCTNATVLCWPSGYNVPCERRDINEGNCTADTACEFHDGYCVNKQEPLPCQKFSENGCPTSSCKWDAAVNMCWYKGFDSPCYFYEPSLCPKDRCFVLGFGLYAMCQDARKPVDCSQLAFNSSDCTGAVKCTGDCEKGYCVPCTPSDTTNCDNTCGDYPSDVYEKCERFFPTKESCNAQPDCTWDQADFCRASVAKPSCADFPEPEECTADHGDLRCKYDLDYCTECSEDGACESRFHTTPDPDKGHSCSALSASACPYPRCATYFEGAGQACRTANCYDYEYDPATCKAQGCQYVESFVTCLGAGEKVPCDYFSEEADCQKQAYCAIDQDTGICVTSADDKKTACNELSWATCPFGRCTFDQNLMACRDVACVDRFTPEMCQADSSCSWSDELFQCTSSSTEECSSFTTSYTCPAACSWTQTKGCIDKLCADYKSSDECPQECTWDLLLNLCFSDPNPKSACSSFHEASCPANRCYFFHYDMDREIAVNPQACINRPCAFYSATSEKLCTSHANCHYDAQHKACYFDEGRPCQDYSTETCPDDDRCSSGPYDIGCVEPGCFDYSDQATCKTKGTNCEWSSQYNICLPQGQAVDCELLGYEFCIGDCTYDKYSNVCYNQKDGEPCQTIKVEKECLRNPKPQCQWVSSSCQPSK